MLKHLTEISPKNGEPQRYSWECRRRSRRNLGVLGNKDSISKSWNDVLKSLKATSVSCCVKFFRGEDSMSSTIEGSRPDWCILSMIYSGDTPFWSETPRNISVTECLCPFIMLQSVIVAVYPFGVLLGFSSGCRWSLFIKSTSSYLVCLHFVCTLCWPCKFHWYIFPVPNDQICHLPCNLSITYVVSCFNSPSTILSRHASATCILFASASNGSKSLLYVEIIRTKSRRSHCVRGLAGWLQSEEWNSKSYNHRRWSQSNPLLACAVVCFTWQRSRLVQKHFKDLLTLHVLYHTVAHQLCRCEVKDVHGLQSFVSTHSEESDSLLFIFCLQ